MRGFKNILSRSIVLQVHFLEVALLAIALRGTAEWGGIIGRLDLHIVLLGHDDGLLPQGSIIWDSGKKNKKM